MGSAVHLATEDVSPRDDPIISQGHEYQQFLAQGTQLCRTPSDQRRRAQIKNDEVGFGADREMTYVAIDAQSTGASQRGEIERAQGRELLMRELRNLVGVPQRPQHAEAAACPNVRGNRKPHAGGVGGGYVKETAAEIEVGGGTECGRCTGLGHPSAIGMIDVDAVRIDRALAQQSITVIHVEIAARAREQLSNPSDLVEAFRRVTLDQGVRKILRQASGALQLRLGGSRGEA